MNLHSSNIEMFTYFNSNIHYLTEMFKDRICVHIYIQYTAHTHTYTQPTAGSCGYVVWEHQLWSKVFLELFVQFGNFVYLY